MPLPAEEDPKFADLIDDLLTQMLDGDEPDLAATATRHSTVAHRIGEAMELVGGVPGRRQTPRPSLQGYDIVREIGRGGMGTVYLARQTSLDREVALKVLPHSIGLSPRSRPRFLAEARALAKVEHEHIVAIHRIVDEGEVLAFEMEFVDGPSLQQLLDHLRAHRESTGSQPTLTQVAERLGLPLAELGARNLTQFFVRLASKVASALGAVHTAGLIHRDVKPANILLRRNGQPVLVDFGLVRLTGREISRAGSFAGTPVYSAPEQLRGDESIGPTADVYGLGVTLYECLTLSTPFAGRSTTDQLRRIEGGRCPPLRRSAPGTPRDLETIVAHAMEVDAERRYGDGGAFADDLLRLLDLQPIQARPAGPVRRVGKFLRRHRNMLLAGSLGAALVAAGMVPILDHVQAAGRRHLEAGRHVRVAHQHLFSIESRHLTWRPAARGSAAQDSLRPDRTTISALSTAAAEYDRALTLDPDQPTARRERDVVRLALWLRQLSIPGRDALDLALDGPEFQQLGAQLGPLVADTARQLALGSFVRQAPRIDVSAASDEDRSSLGLLGFLLGDLRLCELAWQGLSPAQRDEPLVHAALGMMHLADGMPELAYAHLQQAQRSFPDSAIVRLQLAEASLALGDLTLTRYWCERLGDDDGVALGRRRLELDLRAATDFGDELIPLYHELALLDATDPMPRLRMAQMAHRRGDLGEAARRLDELAADWPDVARFRLERARIALQQRDLGSYARQALFVLERDFGNRSPRGSMADLLEILRIGGLAELYQEGLHRTGAEAAGRAFVGGEIPVRAFAPPAIAANFVFLLRELHTVRQKAAALARSESTLGNAPGQALLATPMLLARLPLQRVEDLRLRVLAAFAPELVLRVAPRVAHLVGKIAIRLSGRWTGVPMTSIAAPADLSEALRFGQALCRIDDETGDGVDEVLVSAMPRDPRDAAGRVFVVDGRSGAVLASITTDSDEHMFGFSLAGLGDLDGDGTCDWLIGAPAGTPDARGMAEIWSGRTRRRLARLEGDPGFGVSLAALRDLDADGVPDFAVATAPLLRNTAPQGTVHVYSGRTRRVLRTLRNDVAGVWFGACMANAGDADGDGHDDLLVGGNFGGDFGDAPGLVRLYSGATGAVLQSWSDAVPKHGFGIAVAGIGDVDGDGGADVVVAAVRDGAHAGLDQVYVFSGRTGARLCVIEGSKPGIGFGSAVAPYHLSHDTTLLAIATPLGAVGGSIEFWTTGGQPVSTLLGPRPPHTFAATLLPGQDVDGDGRPELFVTGYLGGAWRIESGQMNFGR